MNTASPSTHTPALAWWRRLHVRLAMGALAVMAAVSAGLAWWLDTSLRHQQDAQWQWQGLGMAAYIVKRQPDKLIGPDGQVRTDLIGNLSMYVGMINPGLELYLVSPDGQVLAHTLEPSRVAAGARVSMAPVQRLVSTPPPQLPVYGDDPSHPGQPNLISVAPLASGGNTLGYLYVVLRGAKAHEVSSGEPGEPLRAAAWRFLPALLLGAALLMGLIQWQLTRPLVRLTESLNRFRPDQQGAVSTTTTPAAARDEVALATQAAEALQQRVQQQMQHIADSEAQRRELIARISHDLHTPLAAVQGYAETLLLRDAQLDAATRQQYLQTLMQNGHRLARRVRNLFELSKLESGHSQPSFEAFDLAELCHDVAQSMQVLASPHGVSLGLGPLDEQAAQGGLQVRADIGLMERVLQNLIDNAICHTPPGGQVRLDLVPEPDAVRVRVSDTGEGIAEEDLPYIFKAYWRRPSGTTPSAQPTAETSPRSRSGLGLSIVQHILALHGQQPEVRSVRGAGTVISFRVARVG